MESTHEITSTISVPAVTDESGQDSLNNNILSITHSNGTFGIASYNILTNVVIADSIVVEVSEIYDILSNLKLVLSPNMIILHPQIICNKPLLDMILSGPDGQSDYYKYTTFKSSCYHPDNCLELICSKLIVKSNSSNRQYLNTHTNSLNMDFPNLNTANTTTTATNEKSISPYDMNTFDTHKNYLFLSSLLDLDNIILRQALGGLLSYIQLHTISLIHGILMISSLETLQQHQYLTMDSNTYYSLNIFHQEIHPNVIKMTGSSGSASSSNSSHNKEGYSLFSLLDRTRSLPGRQLLKEWMKKPYCNIVKINQRLDGIDFVVNVENKPIITEILKSLRKIQDIPKILLRIKKVEAQHIDWCKLYNTLQAGLHITQILQQFLSAAYNSHKTTSSSYTTNTATIATTTTTTTGGKASRHYSNNNDNDNDMSHNYTNNNNRSLVFIENLLQSIDIEAVRQVYDKLHESIDFQETLKLEMLSIRDGYDTKLDDYRHIFNQLEYYLTSTAHQVLDSVPLLQHVSVEYIPQIGYLIAVHETEIHHLQVHIHTSDDNRYDPHESSRMPTTTTATATPRGNIRPYSSISNSGHNGTNMTMEIPLNNNNTTTNNVSTTFQYVYHQNGIYYYKHPLVYQLDDHIGDIKNIILDYQKHLILILEDFLLQHEWCLQAFGTFLATLDVIISLGTIAIENKYVRPDIVEDNIIIIKNGRHPLQALSLEQFIPNDTYITRQKNIAIITGPNSSGKTIYMKQVGLIVYLSHLGSYVPCDKAIIGLTDRIYTRISSIESITSNHSSFTLDMSQINKMIHHHTSKSLCLLDEFGKGTNPIDGISLLATTLKYFALSEKTSRVISVLHFTEIFHPIILNDIIMSHMTIFRMETYEHLIDTNITNTLDGADDEENGHKSGQKENYMSNVCPMNINSTKVSPTISTTPSLTHTTTTTTTSTTATPTTNTTMTSLDSYEKEIVPLYKLKVGIASSSEGIACAKQAGIPNHVLQRAVYIKDCILNKKMIYPSPSYNNNIPTTTTTNDNNSNTNNNAFLLSSMTSAPRQHQSQQNTIQLLQQDNIRELLHLFLSINSQELSIDNKSSYDTIVKANTTTSTTDSTYTTNISASTSNVACGDINVTYMLHGINLPSVSNSEVINDNFMK